MIPGLALQNPNDKKTEENAVEALKHFSTAFFFLILGLITLVLNGHTLALGGARNIEVIAGLHFITLGWLSLSVFGALQIFTGVALGGTQVNSHYAFIGRWSWSLGVLSFTYGLFKTHFVFLVSGLSLIGIGLVFYTSQILPAIFKAKRGQLTRVFISIGFLSLWGVWLLGITGGLIRIGRADLLNIFPTDYLQAHILLALFGWMGSMVIGVGSHLVPMFALSKNTPLTPLKITVFLWPLIPILGFSSAFTSSVWSQVAWTLAGLGSLGWIIQFILFFKTRLRKELDYGLSMTALATAFLAMAWVFSFFTDPISFLALALIGWLSFFTLGIYHRVLPFLVWFMKYSKPQKGIMPPRVKDLVDNHFAFLILTFYGLGIVTWFLGLELHLAILTQGGALLMLLGALMGLTHLRTLQNKSPYSKSIMKFFRVLFKKMNSLPNISTKRQKMTDGSSQ